MPPPDFDGVASVLVSIALRIVIKNPGPKGGLRANPGVLPSLDGGTSGGGLVDRGPDGQTPGLFESARSWRDHYYLRSRISDPGISGKNLVRPGVQQLLAAVEAGHASHVIVWKLDRLSRSLRDLMAIRDLFDKHGVILHSVCENLDLSTPAGRWFFSMMGGQAEYYREALSENVSMGLDRAVKEGRWINKPKTGYDMIDKLLVPNVDAPLVVECFRLRGERRSYRVIEERTGFNYSTVKSILDSRIYRGETLRKGTWYPGVHEPLVSEEEWQKAHRGTAKGVRQSSDPLSGRVVCGMCNRKMVVAQNGKGHLTFKCRHRGEGCRQPSRSNLGLARAAVVGLRLVGHDESLRRAIRRRLADGGPDAAGTPRRTRRAAPAKTLKTLDEQRDKLLGLYYAEKISMDGFHHEEARIATSIEAVRQQMALEGHEERIKSDLEVRFEEVARILADLDMDAVWAEANERERRVLVENLVEYVKVFPDHLEVKVVGSPSINVLLSEVGLKVPENVGVGGPTRTRTRTN